MVTTGTYPKDTAGRLMTNAVPTAHEHSHVRDVLGNVRARAHEYESINYIYIVTGAHELRGVVSLKELMRMEEDATLHECTKRTLILAHPHTDQERLANLALKHNIKAVPVVSKTHEFLGVVCADTISDILHKEHTEDVMRFAGVSHSEFDTSLLLHTSIFTHVRSRAPWLVIGLLGGMFAAFVVGFFESTLADQLLLVAFIPAIVYIADAVGSQTQMLFIRALTIDADLRVRNYLLREISVNIVLAFILSVLIYSISYVWLSSTLVSTIVSVSIFLTVGVSVLVAILLPWLLTKCKQDPAVASGPIATVLRDIMSLCVYLGVATLCMGIF
jgi:magnesium transporter